MAPPSKCNSRLKPNFSPLDPDFFPKLPEEEARVDFFIESGGKALTDEQEAVLTDWIEQIIQVRNCTLGVLHYIFCDDAYLLQINQQYLNHDTYTDIITFPMAERPTISGEIFISTERVAENATIHGTDYWTELKRVVIHGVLHLTGQGDKTEAEAQEMRRLEDWALGLMG